jgi:hypothetical protein
VAARRGDLAGRRVAAGDSRAQPGTAGNARDIRRPDGTGDGSARRLGRPVLQRGAALTQTTAELLVDRFRRQTLGRCRLSRASTRPVTLWARWVWPRCSRSLDRRSLLRSPSSAHGGLHVGQLASVLLLHTQRAFRHAVRLLVRSRVGGLSPELAERQEWRAGVDRAARGLGELRTCDANQGAAYPGDVLVGVRIVGRCREDSEE